MDGKRYIGTSEIKFDALPKTADGTNPVSCAETSATGRALGMAGLGSVESIASAEDVIMAQAEQSRPSPDSPATLQQLDTIRKLQKQAGQSETDLEGLTWADAAGSVASPSEEA